MYIYIIVKVLKIGLYAWLLLDTCAMHQPYFHLHTPQTPLQRLMGEMHSIYKIKGCKPVCHCSIKYKPKWSVWSPQGKPLLTSDVIINYVTLISYVWRCGWGCGYGCVAVGKGVWRQDWGGVHVSAVFRLGTSLVLTEVNLAYCWPCIHVHNKTVHYIGIKLACSKHILIWNSDKSKPSVHGSIF